MISEGTDIPRLQVCCHLSTVKTELYFRQVLGRILRVTHNEMQEAWLYTFAEESLIEFSERVEQDIPESCMFVEIENSSVSVNQGSSPDVARSVFKSQDIERLPLKWSAEASKATVDSNYVGYQESERIKLGNYRERVIAAFG